MQQMHRASWHTLQPDQLTRVRGERAGAREGGGACCEARAYGLLGLACYPGTHMRACSAPSSWPLSTGCRSGRAGPASGDRSRGLSPFGTCRRAKRGGGLLGCAYTTQCDDVRKRAAPGYVID